MNEASQVITTLTHLNVIDRVMWEKLRVNDDYATAAEEYVTLMELYREKTRVYAVLVNEQGYVLIEFPPVIGTVCRLWVPAQLLNGAVVNEDTCEVMFRLTPAPV